MIKDHVSGLPVQPGDFAAVRMRSPVGRLIRIGEVITRFPKDNPAGPDWEHAIFYMGGPQDLILEAEPGGAKVRPFHYAAADVLWSTGRPALALTPEQRDRAFATGKRYEGTPYSALDYFAIAAHRLHVPGWLPFWFDKRGRLVTLKTYVAETGHEICSELTDQCRLDLGSHLFTDPPRWAGYVTPLDIAGLIGGSALASAA